MDFLFTVNIHVPVTLLTVTVTPSTISAAVIPGVYSVA